ncbi:hypothetical protein [Flavobacterium sp.]|uniref:hypothetical protein n=1 Tax=Flavobacterium sp. TaxID=239 RepID=UPI003D6A5E9B
MRQIRESKFTKIVAYYLIIMMFLQVTEPVRMYALTSGPTQPEFNAFTPIGTSDMVDLSSGDFNYNIPVMDVGGYPLNLAYSSGVTMDQEASWVGLGWNLNVGEISRQIRGLPDDFKGDPMRYENNLRDNVTVGSNFNLSPALYGNDTPFTLGLGVQYNNYQGITFKPSVGISYELGGGVQVGVELTGSVSEGASLNPSVSISKKTDEKTKTLGISAGLSSRKGLENVSMSASSSPVVKNSSPYKEGRDKYSETTDHTGSHAGKGAAASGSISFNSQSYTPTKRIGFDNINKTFNATIGGEVFGLEGQVRITGYASYQKILDTYKNKVVGGYGYENTQFKNNNEGVLDFNREKEQVVNKNTNALPVTNYTYDIYNIEGQGAGGMFRPFRSQVGYLYNDEVADFGDSEQFGVELGLGNLVHGGVDIVKSPSKSSTGKWYKNNHAISRFTESNTDINNPLYEPTTYKLIGEMDVDDEGSIYNDIHQNKAQRILLGGGWLDRKAYSSYMVKNNFGPSYTKADINSKIIRKGRLLRNQTVQKISNSEADNKFIFKNTHAQGHHTAGMKVLQADGTTYVYGKTVYNNTKVEATFDVSLRNDFSTRRGLVGYNGSVHGNDSDAKKSDRFVNKITTPSYAHSYLITSVLSTDYEDIDNNGPSDSDLGGYTKFEYTTPINNYRWRVPYGSGIASYNEGLNTSKRDQKGNYIYGEKELTYLKKIETKTHVAFIDLEDRTDAMGVSGEAGGRDNSQSMKRIKSIRLFSKPELKAAGISFETAANVTNTIPVKPIKTAHFEYDYSLCKNIPASSTYSASSSGEVMAGGTGSGKLTLKKVYFTYRGSNMGKFTPYKFDYAENDPAYNPSYDIKGFDIWGNYKKNDALLTTSEYPFVEQNVDKANINTSAWVLKSINLPSGGTINIKTESDDYKFVQDKKAMQMFQVIGAGNNLNQRTTNNELYSGGGFGTHNKYLYVKVGNASMTNAEFKEKYLKENLNKAIYFKFLLKMNNDYDDFVSGYFEIDPSRISEMDVNGSGIAAIPLKFLGRDGGFAGSGQVNPIAKAGWGFGRVYLNKAVYGGSDLPNDNFVSIVKDLVGSIGAMSEIFTGPNLALEIRGCARNFNNQKSWIRLENPNGHKLGGGLRVQKIELSDNWDIMNSVESNVLYKEKYGQEYSYNLDNGTSSGVATFEPNASPENAFVEPFHGKDGNYEERIGAPREINYVEKPFGENFFPSPRITYSRVTVSNLFKKNELDDGKVIKRHATGKVVTEHFTSYNFPTIVDYTDVDLIPDIFPIPAFSFLRVYSVNGITASQGFSIETNDMNGKVKSEQVYAADQEEPISRVEYKYNVGADKKLNNEFTTINAKGETRTNLLGVTYDMVNDFNESDSVTQILGLDTNVATFLVGIFPGIVPMPLPTYAYNRNTLRTATTTKVIHKTGVLVEKVAYDLGSRVSTKNLAWDAKTGQVLLTQTINEFDDNYYSFNYPAYWHYSNMGMASENIDLRGKLAASSGYFNIEGYALTSGENISKYFKIADELVLGNGAKMWVNGYNTDKSRIQLMDKNGAIITQSNLPSNLNFVVVRSGNRNQQMASMAAVTSMVNPIDLDGLGGTPDDITDKTYTYITGSTADAKVVNASAIEYDDDWKSQCENGLPNEAGLINGLGLPVNPYLYNTRGDWRAVKSYAYLTGRNNFVTSNRRKAGYFIKFNPFYKLKDSNDKVWIKNSENWTFASQVTMYSPYGVELENADALGRHSSAQYGYNYTLPVAVSSNAQYREIGFDGFEDYYETSIPQTLKPHFGFSQGLAGDNVFITNNNSHTGHKSIAITAGNKVAFTRKIGGCKPLDTTHARQTIKKVIKLKKA